ncbi:hypothetical protein DVT68_10595 [Dyella solisilvae]|uniref:Nucleotidyl transferase AbiEii/AbiGii toxin family protein n=2 Tax=Dyella solisilvae TaxID=1920168 RepID=A0A370K8H0_9GAMM|nr:hypothetical protein DVT68_10595 [Dyella solisilvae]
MDRFREWFAEHQDQFVLIGGCAASTVMNEEGLEFRATKDIDMVLVVEALTPKFGELFWAFIKAGGYEIKQQSDTGKPCFYRFGRPQDLSFPAMVELFARTPDLISPLADNNNLAPIPIEEGVSSLSAILLDDAYYHFLVTGRDIVRGIPLIREDRLIPFKAKAFLDLSDRGEDSKKVRKHLSDVVELTVLLAPNTRIDLPGQIPDDMRRFLEVASALPDNALARYGGRARFDHVLASIAKAFQLGDPVTA